MTLGEKYLIAWPVLSLFLGGAWIALCELVRRDDNRRKQPPRVEPSNVRVIDRDYAQIVPRPR